MSKILQIRTSPNFTQSLTRSIGDEFLNHWKRNNPNDEIIVRDLAKNPIPFVDQNWLTVTNTPAETWNEEQKKTRALLEELTDEFLSSDIYLFEVPMYNLSIPASFKAYLDQIVVAGKTFAYTPEGPKGIVPEGKKVYVIASSGSNYDQLNDWGINFHEPYLKAIMNFIGITDLTLVKASARTDETFQQEMARISEEFKSLLS